MDALYEGPELTVNSFKSAIFPIKATKGEERPLDLATRLKILIPKQMLQRLPIVFAQLKAGNTSKDLPHEIRQIIYSLYRVR